MSSAADLIGALRVNNLILFIRGILAVAELQITGGKNDNLKIIFLISQ